MGLRIRSFRLALLAATLFVLTALPGAWLPQVPGNAFGPATVWAGGTPDETLAPPPQPSKKSAAGMRRDPGTLRPDFERAGRRTFVTKFDRMMAVWTFVRETTLRI